MCLQLKPTYFEGKLTSSHQVLTYPRTTLATDNTTADPEMETMNYKQPSRQDAIEYVQIFGLKTYAACQSTTNPVTIRRLLK